jgi:bifunctional DNA-binding transcriptional regulator/antitoxin component of YhaV-PrlF toxin-antitoxin module
MVRFHVTVNSQSSIYIPGPVREEFGTKSLQLLADSKAALLYPTDIDLEQVLRSVQILELDLKHILALQKHAASELQPQRRS